LIAQKSKPPPMMFGDIWGGVAGQH
jgi:hypothetical protein